MQITDEFKQIIDNDISACRLVLEQKNGAFTLQKRLSSKYSPIIKDFSDQLHKTSLYTDDPQRVYLNNIQILLEKLELFRALNYENMTIEKEAGINISPTFNNDITLNMTFDQVREKINSNENLTTKETQDAIEKINLLEQISQSSESRKKKWDMAKSILIWLADKSVDVGIALLPLFLKI